MACRLWRGAGIALPVFAARTRNSVGCGEFLDLLPLVEFADASGMRLVQVRSLACQLCRWLRFSRRGCASRMCRCLASLLLLQLQRHVVQCVLQARLL